MSRSSIAPDDAVCREVSPQLSKEERLPGITTKLCHVGRVLAEGEGTKLI